MRVLPPALRPRTWQANTFYCPLLVDGFLAGVWRLVDEALVIGPFAPLTNTQAVEVTEEGSRMPDVLHRGSSYDIRFGTVIA